MKQPRLLLTSLTLTAFAASPLLAADAAKPDADQILRQMGKKIGSARQFSFKAHRQADAALLNGLDAAGSARVSITVARPNKIAAVAVSKIDVRHFYADGKNFTLHTAKQNLYSTVPMRTSLDGLVDIADSKYGFTPPLADFAVSDPYKELRQDAKSVSYLGRSTFSTGFLGSKVECHHVALKGKMADAELWIGVQDQLPRKLIATFKDRPGQPQLKITFSEWNLNARTSAPDFTYVPAKGAISVHMVTTAEMEAAMKKDGRSKN